MAICHPLHAYRMSGISRAAKIIAIIWLVALASAIPFAVFTSITYQKYPEAAGAHLVGEPILESAFCIIFADNNNKPPENWPLLELATGIYFLFPMILLCVLYLRIGIRIRRTSLGRGSNVQSGSVHRGHSQQQQQQQQQQNNNNSLTGGGGGGCAPVRRTRSVSSSRKNILRMLGEFHFLIHFLFQNCFFTLSAMLIDLEIEIEIETNENFERNWK